MACKYYIDTHTKDQCLMSYVITLEDRTTISMWSFEPCQGLAFHRAKAVLLPLLLLEPQYHSGARSQTCDLLVHRPVL